RPRSRQAWSRTVVSPGPCLEIGPQAGLHRSFGLQTLQIPRDRGDCERAACTLKGNGAVLGLQATVHHGFVPCLRVTHILDGCPILFRPEKRYGIESFATPEEITGGDLPLPLGEHPVLDTQTFSRAGIGPARDV